MGRIREAVKDDTKVVDVDGSYTCRKSQCLEQTGLTVSPLEVPPVPPMGWEDVTK